MKKEQWMETAVQSAAAQQLLETNRLTAPLGLTLTENDARSLLEDRRDVLHAQQRVEFGTGILPRIISVFCTSDYITQNTYAAVLARLQDIFFLYKNETMDELSDDELLHFMQQQFDGVCRGDLDYLESTCLPLFAEAVRAGYRGHRQSDGWDEFETVDFAQRWDREVFLSVLEELLGDE